MTSDRKYQSSWYEGGANDGIITRSENVSDFLPESKKYYAQKKNNA